MIKELSNRDKAVRFLAEELNSGSLGLFLGAGISKSFDLSGWLDLLNDIRVHDRLKMEPIPLYAKTEEARSEKKKRIEYSADELQDFANEIYFELKQDEAILKSVVREVLYNGVELNEGFDFFSHKQMVAFSLLISGGLKGRVQTVFTLNYDSLLEWYLSLFGCEAQAVYRLPYKKSKCDVEVFHPHGYLPHKLFDNQESDEIVLARKQADRRLGSRDNLWFDTTLFHLSTKVFLFIGLSESTSSDRMLSTLLTKAFDQADRTLGIWVFRHEIDKNVKIELESCGIAVLILDEEDGIARFVLDICRKSSELIRI